MWVYGVVIVLVLIMSAWLVFRRGKKISVMPEKRKGFGGRDEKVMIVFANGTSRESTWGEIEDKVREINGVSFWADKKRDVILGAAFCIIGVGATFAVYFLQEASK
jgi:hypothetical protein